MDVINAHNGLCPTPHPKFAVETVKIRVHRVAREQKTTGDLGVRFVIKDRFDDFKLPVGEVQ
jgi:hypothetical protein